MSTRQDDDGRRSSTTACPIGDSLFHAIAEQVVTGAFIFFEVAVAVQILLRRRAEHREGGGKRGGETVRVLASSTLHLATSTCSLAGGCWRVETRLP